VQQVFCCIGNLVNLLEVLQKARCDAQQDVQQKMGSHVGLDIFHQSLADFGNDRILTQANRRDKIVVGNNCHWHCGVDDGFLLVLLLCHRHVHNNTRGFLFVQCGSYKILF